MGALLDWRYAGPDLVRMPYFRASWLPKVLIEQPPANDLDGPCWLWQGARDSSGYAVVRAPKEAKGKYGRIWSLHRWVCHHHYGPIPHNHEPDHRCRRRNCFQFGHLEVITSELNKQRANFLRWGTLPVLSAEDLAALADGYWLTQRRFVCSY
jgi:hypothetical protein